jgi:hypothetical protein
MHVSYIGTGKNGLYNDRVEQFVFYRFTNNHLPESAGTSGTIALKLARGL